ncbi:MAG: DUF3027 domain-containing protein, partial [Pseudonocardiaceae bacterium]
MIADTTAPGSHLYEAVELARQAAQAEAGEHLVGQPVENQTEDGGGVTHLFDADLPGYRGWRWSVTVASAGPG